MRYADLHKHNWKEIQEHYDKTNLWGVCDKFKMTTSKLSAAVAQGYLKTRTRAQSRKLSGKDRIPRSAQTKEKIRQGMLKAVKEGRQKTPRPYGRFCKQTPYTNWLGETMVLLGGWEEKVAKYLDDKKIVWNRPKQGIRYYFENKEHYYFPDFYLQNLDLYIEVKGMKTEKDDAKWKQFPFKLKVIDKHHISTLDQFFDQINKNGGSWGT